MRKNALLSDGAVVSMRVVGVINGRGVATEEQVSEVQLAHKHTIILIVQKRRTRVALLLIPESKITFAIGDSISKASIDTHVSQPGRRLVLW
jgi:hypothetical protein